MEGWSWRDAREWKELKTDKIHRSLGGGATTYIYICMHTNPLHEHMHKGKHKKKNTHACITCLYLICPLGFRVSARRW